MNETLLQTKSDLNIVDKNCEKGTLPSKISDLETKCKILSAGVIDSYVEGLVCTNSTKVYQLRVSLENFITDVLNLQSNTQYDTNVKIISIATHLCYPLLDFVSHRINMYYSSQIPKQIENSISNFKYRNHHCLIDSFDQIEKQWKRKRENEAFNRMVDLEFEIEESKNVENLWEKLSEIFNSFENGNATISYLQNITTCYENQFKNKRRHLMFQV